ncbi:hypothetical protein BC833DRAFT_590872 [Globomyces pollinis-pini]|nr:hypothetical protein BC833DRAFT_590872 [Globomyces pollinis-pini]
MMEQEAEAEKYRQDSSVCKLILHKLTILPPLKTFRNLWIVSFAYCKLPVDLTSLSLYVCLGFLDVSFTNINFKQLQETFSKTHILRFHCFQNPMLQIDTGPSYHCGFLSFILPHIWMINGNYISCVDRQKWYQFFTKDHGLYSLLARRWKMNQNPPAFLPTRLKFIEYKDSGRIWTDFSKLWLEDLPVQFNMPLEYDIWKLRRLSKSLEYFFDPDNDPQKNVLFGLLLGWLTPEKYMEHSIQWNFDSSKGSNSNEWNSILVLILVASLFQCYRNLVLINILEQVFKDKNENIPAWVNSTSCPILWPVKERVSLIGLLVGRLIMDHHSTINRSQLKYQYSLHFLRFLNKLIGLINLTVYPLKSLDGFDFDESSSLKFINMEKVQSNLNVSDLIQLSKLHFYIIELTCLCSNDMLFIKDSENYKNYLLDFSKILLINDDTFSKRLDHLKFDYVQEGNQDIQQTEMSLKSKVVEIKIEFILFVRDVEAYLEDVPDDLEFPKSDTKSFMDQFIANI